MKKKRSEVEYKLVFILIISFLIISLLSFTNLTGFLIVGCNDSDNGDKYVKGTLSYQSLKADDECIQDKLAEYFCNPSGIPSVTISECPSGCVNGACKKIENKTTYKEIFQIKQGSDVLEINEFIGDVLSSITSNEMPFLLKSSSISTSNGISRYNQYLTFNDTDLQTGKVKFDEDEGEISDFLFFDEDNYLFEYELDFGNNLISDISSSNKLEDLHNEKLNILGNEYQIIDSNVNGNTVELKFIGGKIKDTLKEGESKTYNLKGKQYNVKLVLVSNDRAIFEINSNRSKTLEEGEVDSLDDISIAVISILEDNKGDLVDFYLDSNMFKFKDTINDDNFRQGVEINGNIISDGFVKIKGEKTSTEVKINNIKYKVKAKGIRAGDLFVPPGSSVKNNIPNPSLFLGSWDILYQGLLNEVKKLNNNLIIFNPSGSKYRLVFTNLKGKTYSIPFISNNAGTLTIGNDEDTLYFIEASSTNNFIINTKDYFILTSKNSNSGITNILRYNSLNEENKQLSVVDLAEGKKDVIYTGTPGTNAVANLVISGRTYKVYIGSAPDYKLAVDLNGDNDLASDEVNIITNGGGILDLGSAQTSSNNFNMTLTTESRQFNKRTTNENINIEVQKDGSSVNINLPSQSDLALESVSGGKEGLSSFGIEFTLTEKSGPDKLTVIYPGQQAEANVSIISY